MSALSFSDLPAHHRRNPALLCNALLSIKEASPELASIADVLVPRLPRRVKASQNIKTDAAHTSSYLYTLDEGVQLPWISWDSAKFRNVIALDIDHENGLELWEELPENLRPFLVIDPYSLRSAALFLLKTPVLCSSVGQLALAELCLRVLASYFNATALPHCSLTKNPFGLKKSLQGVLQRRTVQPANPDFFEAFDGSVLVFHTLPGSSGIELRDILGHFGDDVEAVKRPKRTTFIERGEPSQTGRNCNLFDRLRHFCYDNAVSDFNEIYAEAHAMNDANLPEAELQSIAKSISKFMRTRYRPSDNVKRGVMNLAASSFDMKQKQKLAAKRSSDIKASSTQHKIDVALKHWPEGKKLTQTALSEASGVGLRTVKKLWKDLG